MNWSNLKQLFALIVPLVVAGPGMAQESDVGRQLLDDFVNNVHTISGRFQQQLVDADDQVVDESSGTLEIRRPGQFRWTYLEPYEQMLIADGLNVWSYDVDLEQVTVKSQQDVLANTPALLLGGSQNVLDDFDYVGSFTERGTVWVQLTPRSTGNGFTQLELGFDEQHLSRMIFSDNLGQTTLIAMLDMSVNEPIGDDRFAFTPPPDVDVIGQPLGVLPAEK
jgi:outer membrane lipoprotein carrier protein